MPSLDATTKKTIAIVATVFLFVWGLSLFAQKIDLTTADLGRHIKNGELILNGSVEERRAVFTENFYSYTEPTHPFLNHHWGSGVLFYLIERVAGFGGLSLFFLLGIALSLFFSFDLARRGSNIFIALSLSLFFLPIMAVRSEIRPEVFTYLFSIFFAWLLFRYERGEVPSRALWLLPIVGFFWVNLHIGFIFGIFIIGIFLFSRMVKDRHLLSSGAKRLWIFLCATSFVTLINPAGLAGVLYPFRIFTAYGYRVLENQSVRFIEGLSLTTGYDILLFKASAVLVGFLVLLFLMRGKGRFPLPFFLFSAVFGVLAASQVRQFPLFALFALPTVALLIMGFRVAKQEAGKSAYHVPASLTVLLFALCVLGLVRGERLLEGRSANFGIGLAPGNALSGEFIKAVGISGPIFNNYDIGSYLVYVFAPQTKVFVDNRPEAYPPDFFDVRYIPPQEDGAKFDGLDREIHFNAIIFNYRDATPWAQAFLMRMLADRRFAPVFADARVIIFVRRDEGNKALIQQYEIAQDRFSSH